MKIMFKILVSFTLAILFTGRVTADDLSLFTGIQSGHANVLFVIDTSASMENKMDWVDENNNTIKITRMNAVQKVFEKLIKHASTDFSVGLMRYDTGMWRTAKIAQPIRKISARLSPTTTAMDALMAEVNGWEGSGYTPLSMSMLEAGRYYMGDTPTPRIWESCSGESRSRQCTTYKMPDDLCDNDNVTKGICTANKVYIPPVAGQCTENYIVFLSDGAADYGNVIDYDASTLSRDNIKTWLGTKKRGRCDHEYSQGTADNNAEDCGPDVAEFLYNGPKKIKTHTVSFMLDGNDPATAYMAKLAKKGGGLSYSADTVNELDNVFGQILASIRSSTLLNSSFAAPATLINKDQALTHANDLYMPILAPEDSYIWRGNLKKYALKNGVAHDKHGEQVFLSNKTSGINTFSFDESTEDFWHVGEKSAFIETGGAESHFNPMKRNIYWDTTNGNLANISDLTALNSFLNSTGLASKLTRMGVDSTGVKRWLDGYQYDEANRRISPTQHRHTMGHIVHSAPIVVDFAGESYLLVGTNAGLLHVFKASGTDAEVGEEVFSFMPREFMEDLDLKIQNKASWIHKYGVDGQITVVKDKLETKMWVYFGLRRGGRAYYALEIDAHMSPRLLWKKAQGDAGYDSLGQTWSKPIYTHINHEPVLIFGGGYDENMDLSYDGSKAGGAPNLGNGIYIVDPLTGSVKWSTHDNNPINANWTTEFKDNLRFSFASDVKVADINADGNADQLYAIDVAGQLWRFDIYGTSISGGIIADLKPASTPIKFFNTPDVSILNHGPSRFLSISLGSGWRENPYDNRIADYLFTVRQPIGRQTEYSKTPIRFTDLSDVPYSGAGEFKAASVLVAEDVDGWKYKLPSDGEKVFSNSLTLDNRVIFTTVKPLLADGQCAPLDPADSTLFKVYAMDVVNAKAVADFDGDGEVGKTGCDGERCTLLNMPPMPAPYINDGKLYALLNPANPIDITNIRSVETYWQDRVTGD